MRPYPAYKASGVDWLGEVPEGWEVISSRRLFRQTRDAALEGDEQLSATQKNGVIPQRLFMEQEDQKVVLALAGTGNFKHVEAGDYVISLRSFQGGIEYSAYTGCVSPAYTVLRRNRALEDRYYAYLLKSDSYVSKLQSVTTGIRDGRNISYEQFAFVALPLPPLPEQREIAAFLDREVGKIDALVEESRQLIALLAEKRQATISHAVTRGLNPAARLRPSGIDWLGDIPEGWEALSLRHCLSSLQTGITPSEVCSEAEEPEGFLWYTPGDFGETLELGRSSRRIPLHVVFEGGARVFPEGSVLVVSIGATLGKVGVSSSRCSANQQINAVIPNAKVSSRFLGYSLAEKAAIMRYLSNASTIGIMNQEKTKEIVIAVPPRSEQDEIIAYLDQIGERFDALTAEANSAISLLLERRAALISAAVTGKIDVRGAAPAPAQERT